jgi:hypothetical protein
VRCVGGVSFGDGAPGVDVRVANREARVVDLDAGAVDLDHRVVD